MTQVPSALIDLGAIRYNLGVVRRHAPKSRVWAVIKADAYGHGVDGVANALAPQADGFALARVRSACSSSSRAVIPACTLLSMIS